VSLEFRHIAHAYGQGAGSVNALEDISLTAPEGAITCLLGASGCGKSTLLNLAAGLLKVQNGSIHVGGELLADPAHNPPPEARPVGLVFQDGALFPHMTVAQNVAFGVSKGERGAVEGWLEQVGLAGLGARYPHELSGGQQQRAALARAMAPGPAVLLMDEPFASVDIVLRRKLRRDCRRLLRSRGATVVLVTHDPEEALDIGDRIAVMEAGRIVQVGSPQELHDAPAAPSVGAMFGGAQIVRAMRGDAGLETAFGVWPVESVPEALPNTSAMTLLVDAKDIELSPDAGGLAVKDLHPLGHSTRVLLDNGQGGELTVEVREPVDPSRLYRATPRAGRVKAFSHE
jgi:iron(III) transport system ATP-binding protein